MGTLGNSPCNVLIILRLSSSVWAGYVLVAWHTMMLSLPSTSTACRI